MKKFIIISTILILVAAGLFGYSLYHYLDITGALVRNTNAAATADTAAPNQSKLEKATEAGAETRTAVDDSAGIFAAGREKAAKYVESLSTEEMVGQMILGICADANTASDEMNKYSLGGMLFEAANFQLMNSDQVIEAVKNAQAKTKIKPILAATEEGGMYTTVSDVTGFTEYDFNPTRQEFAAGGLQAVEKEEDSKVELFKKVGLNLNLAPVVDICDSGDQIMYSRSMDGDAEKVSAYAEYCAKFDQAKGVSVALKHFPGYGTIPDSANTGIGAVVDERTADSIRSKDYVPFKKGVEAGAHFVMVSNVVVKNIDASHTAALSPALHNELRDTVGFTGLIMTDVLDDADYSAYADGKKPVVQAVLAGNDVILVRNYAAAHADILAAVKSGEITEEQLKNTCTRIISYKYAAGLMS